MAEQLDSQAAVVSPVNVQEFSKKVKEKYPEYKDVDDVTLAKKIVEKYPEYKDKVQLDPPEPQQTGLQSTNQPVQPNNQDQPLTYIQKELINEGRLPKEGLPYGYSPLNEAKENPVEEQSFVGKLRKTVGNEFMTGLNNLNSWIADAPGFIYDLAGSPFRAVGLNVPTSKDFKDTPLENISDYYKNNAKAYETKVKEVNPERENGVISSFKNGDIKGGILNLSGSIAESTPASIAMMLSGGATMPTILGGAAVFGAGKAQEIDENSPDMDYDKGRIVAAINGTLEGIFETYLGSGAVGKSLAGIIKNQGKDVAKDEVKKSLSTVFADMITKNPWLAPLGEGFEEVGTQISQNLVDKYSGYKPELGVMDGVGDSFLAGVGMGGIHGAVIGLAKKAIEERQKTPITTATIEGQQFTINNPEDLGQEGKPIFAKDAEGNVTAVPNHKVTDPVTQTVEQIDQANQQVSEQAKLYEGISDPNAQVTDDIKEGDIRLIKFSNGQSKIITPEGEVVANNQQEEDRILESVVNGEQLPQPKATESGEVIASAPEKKVVTQKFGNTPIDIIENEGYDEVVPSEKVPLEKALTALEKKFENNPKFELQVEKVQVEEPGETKYDDPVKKTVIKSIRIVPKTSQNANIEDAVLNKVSETQQQLSEQQNIENNQVIESSQKNQLQNENNDNVFEKLKNVWNKIYFENRNKGIFDDGFVSTGFDEAIPYGSDNLASHGMAKSGLGSALSDLIGLFENGIDINRRGGLDTAPLTNSSKAQYGTTGGGTSYRDGAFILVGKRGHVGKFTNINQIGGILVNDGVVNADPQIIDLLREYFPNLSIESFNNASELTQQLNKNEESENVNREVAGTAQQTENAPQEEQGQGIEKGLEENVKTKELYVTTRGDGTGFIVKQDVSGWVILKNGKPNEKGYYLIQSPDGKSLLYTDDARIFGRIKIKIPDQSSIETAKSAEEIPGFSNVSTGQPATDIKTADPVAEQKETRDQLETRLLEERKQRILTEGTGFDKEFGLIPPSEIKSADDILSNIDKILSTLKANEGNGTYRNYEGYSYGGKYVKNAGEQIRGYFHALDVLPNEIRKDFASKINANTQQKLMDWASKKYKDIIPDVSNEFDQVRDVAGQDSGQRPAVKEPWEMTRDEWESNLKNAIGTNPDNEDFDEIKRLSYNIEDGKGTGENNFATHEDVINQALSQGKPIPEEVLNDYPELKPVVQENLNTETPQKVSFTYLDGSDHIGEVIGETKDGKLRIKAEDGLIYRMPKDKVSDARLRVTEKEGSLLNVSEEAAQDIEGRTNLIKTLDKISSELGEPVNIINSEEIPESVNELKKQIKEGNRVPAFFLNGEVYIISDQIQSVSDAVKSYVHETIVHKGLRNTFAQAGRTSIIGKQYAKLDDLLIDVFGSMSRSQKMQIANFYAPGLYENGRLMRNPTDEEKALIGEEFLAHVSENPEIYDASVLSKWQEWINRLAQIIRKAFRLTSNQFSQNDLLDIIREQRRRMGEQKNVNADEETRLRIIGETGAGNLDKAEEATTRLDNLAIAREMEQAGKDVKSIHLATGWEKGVDGKWRYEVPDIELKKSFADIINQVRNTEDKSLPLSQVIEDENLFKEYPKLKDTKILFYATGSNNITGFANNTDNIIGITVTTPEYEAYRLGGAKESTPIRAYSDTSFKSVLSHEIQHQVQFIEGFGRGGNPETVFTNIVENRIRQLQKVSGKNAISESEREEIEREARRKYETSHGAYKRLVGEVESRNVQTRMNMTPEERLNTLLSETEDVAREDQIVLMDGLGISNLENLSLGENKPMEYLKSKDVETGKPVTMIYLKNTEKAPYLGSRFGQDVEPSGFYFIQKEHEFPPSKGWIEGQITLNNPLVIPITDETMISYKNDLSKKYGGKKNKALTNAIKKDGYDGIITTRDGYLGEMIKFDFEPSKQEEEPITNKIEQQRSEVNTDPSEAQKEANNYKHGHVRFDGFDISIENPKGSVRSGVDKQGNEWSQTLPADYGYFRGTVGKDKDHVDVFIGNKPEASNIYIVDQIDPNTGKFDEHKIMLGFDSQAKAKQTYLAAFEPGWKGLGKITKTDKQGLKEWFEKGDQKKPFSDNVVRFRILGDPRSGLTNIRGSWTKAKIIKELKEIKKTNTSYGKFGLLKGIASFENAQDLRNHLFYHGTGGGVSGALYPSITMSEREAERNGGGGYGQRYFAISVSKSKRKAASFSGQSRSISVYPVILNKEANVIDRPDLNDSNELDDIIEELWNDKVDAVRLGDWSDPHSEQELAVINPNAISTWSGSDSRMVYGMNLADFNEKTDEELENIIDKAKSALIKMAEWEENNKRPVMPEMIEYNLNDPHETVAEAQAKNKQIISERKRIREEYNQLKQAEQRKLADNIRFRIQPRDERIDQLREDLNKVSRLRTVSENDLLKSVNETVESNMNESYGIKKTPLWERIKQKMNEVKESTQHFKFITEKDFPEVYDKLRQFEAIPDRVKKEAYEKVSQIVRPLIKNEEHMRAFERYIVLSDLVHDIEETSLFANKQLPWGYNTIDEIKQDMRNVRAYVMRTPQVLKAIRDRQAMMKEVKKELVANKLLKDNGNTDYFHHQVLAFMDGKANVGVSAKDVRNHKKGWQRSRQGSIALYNTNYIESEFEVMAQSLEQLAIKNMLGEINESINIMPQLIEKAQKEGGSWRDYIPDGYKFWFPKPGTNAYKAATFIERAAQNLMASPQEKELQEILAEAEKGMWVIPEPVAKQLDEMKDPEKEMIYAQGLRAMTNKWKQWTLLNPFRAAKYNFNNMSGDLDIVLAYDPKILQKKYAHSAMTEALNEMRGAGMSEDMKEALRYGVITSGLSIQEIPDINNQSLFRAITKGQGNWVKRVFGKTLGSYWSGVTAFTQFRENILRVAAYKFFKEQIKQGKQPFGVSNHDAIQALYTSKANPNEIAGKLARELMGDYGNLSQGGQWIRAHSYPFWSWVEVNAPRYYRLLQNTKFEGNSGVIGRVAGVGAKKTAVSVGMLGVRVMLLTGLVMLWNQIMFPDEDDELQKLGDDKLKLIVGRRDDGSIITIKIQGAFSDVLSFFSLEDAVSDVKELKEGKTTAGKKLAESGNAFVNKFAQGAMPITRATMELAMGKSLYPDIFNPTYIRDKGEHAARFVSMDKLYNYLTHKPVRSFGKEVSGLLVYDNNPGEAAYYTMRQKISDFLKDNDENGPSTEPSDKSNALYYYKKSLKFGDQDGAKFWFDKYRELGGTGKGYKTSMKKGILVNSVPRELRAKWFNSLDPEDKEILDLANRWYMETYLKVGIPVKKNE